MSISKAALSKISNKKFKASNFQYQYTSKATDLHQDLKALGSIIQTTKKVINDNLPIPNYIITTIQQLNTKHEFEIPTPPSSLLHLAGWVTTTK